jgi:hypothetical protein
MTGRCKWSKQFRTHPLTLIYGHGTSVMLQTVHKVAGTCKTLLVLRDGTLYVANTGTSYGTPIRVRAFWDIPPIKTTRGGR